MSKVQEFQEKTAALLGEQASTAAQGEVGESPVDDVLPEGWTESTPGRLATNPDPLKGGIIDREIVSGKWFVVFNRDELVGLKGFGSRQSAFAAFHAAMREHVADRAVMSQSDRATRFLAVHSDLSIETGVPMGTMGKIAKVLAARGMTHMAEMKGLDFFVLDRGLTGAVDEVHSRSIALPGLNAVALEHGSELKVTDTAGRAWRIDEGVAGYGAEATPDEVVRPRMRA